MNKEPFAIFCSCYSPEHTLQVYMDEEDKAAPEVVLTIALHKPTLWQRVKYLMGWSPWSGYSDILWTKQQVPALKSILSFLEGEDSET